MSTLHILDKLHGDRTFTWTEDDDAAVRAAREAAAGHLASGGALIRTQPGPETVVRDLDPAAEEYVGIMPIQGG
jgi:hypothetical protein